MDLESFRCIVSCQERDVEVRPTYTLFSLETQSPSGHLNIYDIGPIKNFGGGGSVIRNN